jgi:hypothetical protein
MLRRVWNWMRGRAPVQLPNMTVILYTRAGCHLCETAEQHLRHEQNRFGFALQLIDVDTSADLVERYGEWIPVVTVAGKVRFKGEVNPVLLRRLLEAEAQRTKTPPSLPGKGPGG